MNGPDLRAAAPMPSGIGLRGPHQLELLDSRPSLGFVEAHSENYFGPGGRAIHFLERSRAIWPVSLHGIGLSLGSPGPLDERHLANLARLVHRVDPFLVSDHLCWCALDGRHAHDLLPLPYTEEALGVVADRVDAVQERLGRSILLENPSTYLEFAQADMSEPAFLAAVAARTGCGILLDVNNVHVSATNQGRDAAAWLDAIPVAAVAEIHLAGHTRRRIVHEGGETLLLIDTHDRPVPPPVWALYRHALTRFGPVPTLVEWDADLPTLDVLVLEAARADRIATEVHRATAA